MSLVYYFLISIRINFGCEMRGMNIYVRLGAGLAHLAGSPRLVIVLEEDATIADLLDHLRTEQPGLAQRLDSAVPMISGRHAAPAEPLATGQEVTLLLPVAGGAR
jgi:molybdopterin converting factor small subunit